MKDLSNSNSGTFSTQQTSETSKPVVFFETFYPTPKTQTIVLSEMESLDTIDKLDDIRCDLINDRKAIEATLLHYRKREQQGEVASFALIIGSVGLLHLFGMDSIITLGAWAISAFSLVANAHTYKKEFECHEQLEQNSADTQKARRLRAELLHK